MSRGRVAVVTGAARGIGAATVLALAGAGWSVLAVDSTADDPALPYPMATPGELSSVVRQASGSAGAGRVGSFIADVRDQGAVTAAVAEAERRWGGLDAAVAAAGVIAGGVPLWEVPLAQQQTVLDVDLGGVLSLARAAVPALLRRPTPRSGRFLAVASAAATRGLPMLAAYCAAKAGVTGLIRALAAELADSGVTANAVSPGSTATPILDESARLYRLPGRAGVRQPAARRTAARPRRDSRRAGVPGQPGEQRDDRRHRAGGRGPRAVSSQAREPTRQARGGGASDEPGQPAAARRLRHGHGPGHQTARRATPCSAAPRPACCGCPGPAATALAELRTGPVRSAAAGRLARKLTDAGLAHPRPPELTARPDVTVLIPVRDRPVLLDRCLAALGRSYPVVVVDDGSCDPAAVAAVAAAHGVGTGAAAGQRRRRSRAEHRPARCDH